MANEKDKKERVNATRSSVRKEMAKPRMARSAKIAEQNLNTARISDHSSVTLPRHSRTSDTNRQNQRRRLTK
jgi:hypothetical protein